MEILKDVITTWPCVILIFLMFFSILFRKQISNFLARLVNAKIGNLNLAAMKPTVQPKKAIQDKLKIKAINYIKLHPEETIKEFYGLLDKYKFERIFNIIYGSQILLLEHLSLKGDIGDKYINLYVFYDEFIKKTIPPRPQITEYFGFLESWKLIEASGENMNKSYKITPFGINFLSYIKTNYPLYKYKNY
jgi:hypothetical protein